jgi:hypothetical protein
MQLLDCHAIPNEARRIWMRQGQSGLDKLPVYLFMQLFNIELNSIPLSPKLCLL